MAFLVDDTRDSGQSYAWVVRTGFSDIRPLDAPHAKLAAMIKVLRRGLDFGSGQQVKNVTAEPGPWLVSYDVELARQIYDAIWSPIAPWLEGVDQVLVVPDGPLESLPLQVLVTDAPKQPLESDEDLRKVAWLARRHAFTVLPNVSSLRALREFAATAPSGDRFYGFGDPGFEGNESATDPATPRSEDGVPNAQFCNATTLRNLGRLKNTESELKDIAASLGASEDGLRLGPRASDKEVKSLDQSGALAQAGVIAFSTHGFAAGEMPGVSEPGLALAPESPDDGCLTASEVAQLHLNADWVVLSACNTAAADGTPGARPLSGLARAFFYAGARAVLVSNWPVDVKAATALTTGTFKLLRDHPKMGRSEALQQTMISLLEEGPDPRPTYWAPFSLVGEGGTPLKSAITTKVRTQ